MRTISETVQHHARSGTEEDAHGNEIDTWADPVPVGIYAFNPGGTTEPEIPGYARVVTKPTIYLPGGHGIGPHDRVTVRGVTYAVDGDALEFRNPHDSSMDGDAINLKGVTG